jgi:hypothetical protein
MDKSNNPPTAPTQAEHEIEMVFEKLGLAQSNDRQRVLDRLCQTDISHPKTFKTSFCMSK